MPDNQSKRLPIVDGLRPLIRRTNHTNSGEPQGYFIVDADAPDAMKELRKDGRWCSGFDAQCVWPTREAAEAFLRSLAPLDKPEKEGQEEVWTEFLARIEAAAAEIVKWFFECDGTQPQKEKETVAILRRHFCSPPAAEGELPRVRTWEASPEDLARMNGERCPATVGQVVSTKFTKRLVKLLRAK